MDPPQHNLHRKLVIGQFTPAATARLEARVREIARESLAAVPTGEPVDFVEAVAIPLPMLVIAELLGIPKEDRDRFRVWSDAMIEAGGGEVGESTTVVLAEMLAYLGEQIELRRKEERDDLITLLLQAEVEGARLTTSELLMFFMTLLVAGNETTRTLIAGGARALLDHPPELAKLKANPALLPNAVEEMLRYVTPLHSFARCATEDTELAGRLDSQGRLPDPLLFGRQPGPRGVRRRRRRIRRRPSQRTETPRIRLGGAPVPGRASCAARGAGDVRGAPAQARGSPLRRRHRAPALPARQRHRAHARGVREVSSEAFPLRSPRPRPDGREQRSMRTRARIFDAALEEFGRVGIENASVSDIARAARVSRPSFYFHFPSKEHVLLELQWQAEQRIVDDVAAEEGAADALHTFADRLAAVEVELGSGELFRDILQLWARGSSALEGAGHPLPVLHEIVRRFQQHQREGARLAMEPERAAVLFLSGVFGYLLGVADDEGQRAADLHALVRLHLADAPG